MTTREIPKVGDCMTSPPVSIPLDLSIADASQRMFDHGIRHLPIVDDGTLVGILTERDVALVESVTSTDPSRIKLRDVMTPAPYSCPPATPVDEVVATMRERKIGAAIVMENHEVKGVFTTIDALGTLLKLLQS